MSITQILLVTVNPHYARFYLVLLIVGYFRTAAIFLGGETARTPTSFHRPLDFPDFSLSSKCFEMNHFPLSNFWVTFIIIDIDIADFKLHHPREKSELQYQYNFMTHIETDISLDIEKTDSSMTSGVPYKFIDYCHYSLSILCDVTMTFMRS